MTDNFFALLDLTLKSFSRKSRAFYVGFCSGVIFATAWVIVVLNILSQFIKP